MASKRFYAEEPGSLFEFVTKYKYFKPYKPISHTEAGLAESGQAADCRNLFPKTFTKKNVDIRVRRFESGTRLHNMIT